MSTPSTPTTPPPSEPGPTESSNGVPPDPGLQWKMKSFDFVADATKQVITVAAGVITATVIFSKDLTFSTRLLATVAWIFLLVSVVFGGLMLFNLSGVLAAFASGNGPKEGINERGSRKLATGQLITFLLGLFFVLVFGFFAVRGNGNADKDKSTPPQAVTVTGSVSATVNGMVTCAAPPVPKPPAVGGTKSNQKRSGGRKHVTPPPCPATP
jgi:hypothetical protein